MNPWDKVNALEGGSDLERNLTIGLVYKSAAWALQPLAMITEATAQRQIAILDEVVGVVSDILAANEALARVAG